MQHSPQRWWAFSVATLVAISFPYISQAETGQACGMVIFPSPQTVGREVPCENGRTVFGPMVFTTTEPDPDPDPDPPGCDVTDVKANKVEICHIPPDDPANAHTVQIGKNATNAHLAHGDTLGACGCDSNGGNGGGEDPTEPDVFGFDTTIGGGVCVTVNNAGADSASVFINGDTLFGPADFSMQLLETETDLAVGMHELQVQVDSPEGSEVTVEIRESFPILDDDTVTIEASGNFQVYNVATDHPFMTPNGDGHHDGTTFTADTEPLEPQFMPEPGVDYFLNWEFQVHNLDDCSFIYTGLSGMKQINSPTNVRVLWDGTDVTGALVTGGNYGYTVLIVLVDENGVSYGSVSSPTFGMIVDPAPADYTEQPEFIGTCDPENCACPSTAPSQDYSCDAITADRLPPTKDPDSAQKGFLGSLQDPLTGRWRVFTDLRGRRGAGHVVLQHDGVWASEANLRNWVSVMTGVPESTGDSLFNFDYLQFGTSTAVTTAGIAPVSFNHFFLDAITDQYGDITVGGVTTSLADVFGDDIAAPPQYVVDSPRDGEECTHNGNGVGDFTLAAKLCSRNTAVRIGDATDLGIYGLRSSVFDVSVNGQGSTQEVYCPPTGPCGVRVQRYNTDVIEIEATYYSDSPAGPAFAASNVELLNITHAFSFTRDRGDGANSTDGVCTRAVTVKNGLRVRMDTVDGSVPDTCVANGIFF